MKTIFQKINESSQAKIKKLADMLYDKYGSEGDFERICDTYEFTLAETSEFPFPKKFRFFVKQYGELEKKYYDAQMEDIYVFKLEDLLRDNNNDVNKTYKLICDIADIFEGY